MSKWTDIQTEVEGVEKAVRNLDGEPRQIARYIYDRASAYVGADHEGVTVALMEAGFRPDYEPQPDDPAPTPTAHSGLVERLVERAKHLLSASIKRSALDTYDRDRVTEAFGDLTKAAAALRRETREPDGWTTEEEASSLRARRGFRPVVSVSYTPTDHHRVPIYVGTEGTPTEDES